MLKVGGKLSYSTCSLNPVENEAVIAAALSTYPSQIRLLKVGLPGFQFQQGMTDWDFMNLKSKEELAKEPDTTDYFHTFAKFEDVPDEMLHNKNTKVVRPSMFASHYPESIRSQLSNCLRVMPHHQNTSGFFITIIEKTCEFEGVRKVPNKGGLIPESLPLEI